MGQKYPSIKLKERTRLEKKYVKSYQKFPFFSLLLGSYCNWRTSNKFVEPPSKFINDMLHQDHRVQVSSS
jgi:hypothetical protein